VLPGGSSEPRGEEELIRKIKREYRARKLKEL
jgi:hypothetical protein